MRTPNIEVSPQALIEIRIKVLEGKFREIRHAINFADKILLEVELGTAYLELKEIIKKDTFLKGV